MRYYNYKGEECFPQPNSKELEDTRLYKRIKYIYVQGRKIEMSYYVKRFYTAEELNLK